MNFEQLVLGVSNVAIQEESNEYKRVQIDKIYPV